MLDQFTNECVYNDYYLSLEFVCSLGDMIVLAWDRWMFTVMSVFAIIIV